MAGRVRQFTCRDDLWARVEALAERRGIRSDDVVQAALIQLFTRRRQQAARVNGIQTNASGAPLSKMPTRQSAPVASRPGQIPPPTVAPYSGAPVTGAATPGDTEERAVPAREILFLYFEGQCYEIAKDQFVIGRGSKYSDLAIKDANISRRHCAVVRKNGQYFIKDLESTNGVEFNGQQVDNHLIQEGTTYKLCDHEVRFSFIPPN